MHFPTTTIFDYYHEWKMESVDTAIKSLPSIYQPIFKDAMEGHTVQLEQYLACLEISVESAINFTDERGRFPIHFGAAFGQFEVVKLLLSHGEVLTQINRAIKYLYKQNS